MISNTDAIEAVASSIYSISFVFVRVIFVFPVVFFFFFNDTATTEIYTNLNTLSLHDALPIYSSHIQKSRMPSSACDWSRLEEHTSDLLSHSEISYAVFCLKKK